MSSINPTSISFSVGELILFDVELEDEFSGHFHLKIEDLSGNVQYEDGEERKRHRASGDPQNHQLACTKKLEPATYRAKAVLEPDSRKSKDSEHEELECEFTVGELAPMRVALVKERHHSPEESLPRASFSGFQEHFEQAEGGSRHGKKGGIPGIFRINDYAWLKDEIGKYLKGYRDGCASLEDLMPAGYLDARKKADIFQVLWGRPEVPCLELIWNYWHEEGMLIQTLNVILARFQNRRISDKYDALSRFDLSPLWPLAHGLLYPYVDDEINRMTVRRRAAEYEYEYGLSMIGRAVPPTRMLVERRTGFLPAFHQILHQAHVYFKEADDLTVHADAFPLYRSLRECHLILSQGSHNQFNQAAFAARAEFLTAQYLLARPEMREFLGGKPMTPYPEPWMDRVDTMKAMQGWGDSSVIHFHDLADLGERLVLTIRWGNWTDTQVGADAAADWADAFRPAVQKYVAAYRAVTGVDLSQRPDATMPSELLAARLRTQAQQA